MGNVVYNLRVNGDGTQRSAWPMGDYNSDPGGSPTLVDGEEITLVFPSVGVNVPASNQAFLGGVGGHIEQGAVGTLFRNSLPPNWGALIEGPKYSSARSLNGTRSLLNDRANSAFQFGARHDTGGNQRVMLYRYSYYFENPNHTKGQLKLSRSCGSIDGSGGVGDGCDANIYMTTHPASAEETWLEGDSDFPANDDQGATSAERNRIIYHGQPGWHREDTWVTVEWVVVDNSTPTALDGAIFMVARREDTGEIISNINLTNIRTRVAAESTCRWHILQGYMGNGYDAACKLYFDRDIYLSHSTSLFIPKSILLGDAPTWGNVQRRTICEYTSWVDNGITTTIRFKMNKGRHLLLDDLYAYVTTAPNTPASENGVALLSGIQ